jgi:hypothetical protein
LLSRLVSLKKALSRRSRFSGGYASGDHGPGWVERLLTHRIDGLDNYQQMLDILLHEKNAIKVYVEIAPV